MTLEVPKLLPRESIKLVPSCLQKPKRAQAGIRGWVKLAVAANSELAEGLLRLLSSLESLQSPIEQLPPPCKPKTGVLSSMGLTLGKPERSDIAAPRTLASSPNATE